MIEIVTIGVYGVDEAGFFAALQAASVDIFCDLRARRGLRGVDYVYATPSHQCPTGVTMPLERREALNKDVRQLL